MNQNASLAEVALGFATLVMLPFVGLLGLLRKRALPFLLIASLLWLAGGLTLAANGQLERLPAPAGWSARKLWYAGLVVGALFVLLAWLKQRRPVSKGLKVFLTITTLVIFAKSLWLFLDAYLRPAL